MRVSRRHLDILLFGALLLLGAYIVRGWIRESDAGISKSSSPGSEHDRGKGNEKPPPPLVPAPTPVPAREADAVSLVERIDPVKDKVAGDWSLRDQRLLVPNAKWARLQLPVIPPEEYDLDATVIRTDREDALILGIVYQGRQCQIVLDGNGGRASWIEVKGGGHGITPFGVTFFDGNVFFKGRPAQLRVSVRKDRLTLLIDSFQVLDFIGPRDRLFVAEHWEVPDPRVLYLGAWESMFAIDHLRLLPIQGSVAFTR